jgi:hypothetical protein
MTLLKHNLHYPHTTRPNQSKTLALEQGDSRGVPRTAGGRSAARWDAAESRTRLAVRRRCSRTRRSRSASSLSSSSMSASSSVSPSSSTAAVEEGGLILRFRLLEEDPAWPVASDTPAMDGELPSARDAEASGEERTGDGSGFNFGVASGKGRDEQVGPTQSGGLGDAVGPANQANVGSENSQRWPTACRPTEPKRDVLCLRSAAAC